MTSLLKFENVHFRYPNGKPVLKELSFEVNQGETLALLGPNGSGKSTSIKCGLGLQNPQKGRIQKVGLENLGYVPQASEFPEQSRVCDLVKLVAGHYRNASDQDEVIEAFGLKAFWKSHANNLSGGQKRCVSLALAFIGQPQLVILDEPSVGIDIEMRERLTDYIKRYRESGGSVLLTTHYIEEAEQMADRVILLSKGRILREGGVKEVRDSLGLSRIRFFIDGELPSIDALDVKQSGQMVDILSENSDQAVDFIVRNVKYRNLEVQSASLEEAIRGLISGADL